MTKQFRQSIFWVIGVLLFTLSLAWFNREAILRSIGNFLIVQDTPSSVDLIHVLGGNSNRGKYAAELYHKGYAPRLFFSGETPINDQPIHPDYISQSQAIAQGVDPQAILPVISTATNTYEEAVELKQLLFENPDIQSVIIISDAYHMRRASWIFNRLVDDRAKLYFVPIPTHMSHVSTYWWQSKGSRHTIGSEYLKFLYYTLVYLW